MKCSRGVAEITGRVALYLWLTVISFFKSHVRDHRVPIRGSIWGGGYMRNQMEYGTKKKIRGRGFVVRLKILNLLVPGDLFSLFFLGEDQKLSWP